MLALFTDLSSVVPQGKQADPVLLLDECSFPDVLVCLLLKEEV